MPRLTAEVFPAPTGMDSTNHPGMLPPQRGRRISGFRADRTGRLRGCIKTTTVTEVAECADGIAYYYGTDAEDDRLLYVTQGSLFAAVPTNIDAEVPTWTPHYVGGGFQTGKAVRFAAYDTETILVQEGGIAPKRYDGTGLYQLGITLPSAPSVTAGTPTSGTGAKKGVISYTVSYFDSRYRESDVSSGTSISYVTNSGKSGRISLTGGFGSDPQVFGAYIYATTSGGTSKYRIATLLKSAGVTVWEDNVADSTVNTGALAPSPGQYAVPNEASCVAVHKKHIVLNDTTSPKTLQINNLDAPTQWASVNYQTTDGTRLSIGTHQGAGINALVPFGSLLMVSTRGELLQLWGDDPAGGRAPFQLRSIHKQGVLAPGSFARCNNVVVGVMDDGKVWQLSGYEGFPTEPLSAEIESLLSAHTTAELEAAQATFAENCYLLAIGSSLYGWDFAAQGWFMHEIDTESADYLRIAAGL